MAWWLTIYCRRPVSALAPARLLAGIQGHDSEALAGVDYWTLAEQLGIEDEAVVDAALDVLRVRGDEELGLRSGCEICYRPEIDARPIVLHCWSDPARVAEELQEAEESRSPPPGALSRLRAASEVVGIELGFSQLEDMGLVIAYEIARWLAQRGDGLVVDDDAQWMAVESGAWVDP
jgi:hypothetical protein